MAGLMWSSCLNLHWSSISSKVYGVWRNVCTFTEDGFSTHTPMQKLKVIGHLITYFLSTQNNNILVSTSLEVQFESKFLQIILSNDESCIKKCFKTTQYLNLIGMQPLARRSNKMLFIAYEN